MRQQGVFLTLTVGLAILAHQSFGDMAAKKRTALDWFFLVFIAVSLPVLVLLGYNAYRGIVDQIAESSRNSQNAQVQELEHRIRAEEGRKCVLDGIDALGRGEPIPKPPECESPDLSDLQDALARAEGRLIDR